MAGVGPEFLQLLKGIEWDGLTARAAVELRAALKEAVGKSDEWFVQLTRDFGGRGQGALPREGSMSKIEDGRPAQTEANTIYPPNRHQVGAARVTRPLVKRKRGRPRKVSPVVVKPNPLAVGGANAEATETAAPARLFANSYVSRDGPLPGAALPPDHPRRNLSRESSVTPEVDMSDFEQAEAALQKGQLNKLFQS